jgi:hypothetical protein
MEKHRVDARLNSMDASRIWTRRVRTALVVALLTTSLALWAARAPAGYAWGLVTVAVAIVIGAPQGTAPTVRSSRSPAVRGPRGRRLQAGRR